MNGKHVLGTVWYIFRFQDAYELTEYGSLFGLFALEACFQRCWTLCWEDSDPASLDKLSMKPSFLVFRRHWVAVAGNECRERPWNRLLLDKFCVLQITDFKYSVPVHFVLFCFADWQQSCAYNRLWLRIWIYLGQAPAWQRFHYLCWLPAKGRENKNCSSPVACALTHSKSSLPSPLCTAFCQGEGGWLVAQRERCGCLNFTEKSQDWMISREVLI